MFEQKVMLCNVLAPLLLLSTHFRDFATTVKWKSKENIFLTQIMF